MSTCTCHSIREGHGGITYTLHILGVLCDHCEAAIADAEAQAAWDAMTPAEQIAARWNYGRRYSLPRRRPGAPVIPDAAPF